MKASAEAEYVHSLIHFYYTRERTGKRHIWAEGWVWVLGLWVSSAYVFRVSL